MFELMCAYVLAGLVGALSIIVNSRVEHKNRLKQDEEFATFFFMVLAWPLILTVIACGDWD